jgi:hypothetical protein
MLAGVAHTTSLRWDWQVTIRESLPDRLEPSPVELGTGSRAPTTGRPPPRRLQLPEMQMRLEGNDWDQGLPDDPANRPEATAHLARGTKPDHRGNPADLATLPAP